MVKIICVLFGLLVCGLTTHGQVHFMVENLEEGLELAKKENKPVFVYYATPWSMACQWVESETFSKPILGNSLNNYFINVYLKANTALPSKLIAKYQLSSIPTYLFLEPSGKPLHPLPSTILTEDLVPFTKNLVWLIKQSKQQQPSGIQVKQPVSITPTPQPSQASERPERMSTQTETTFYVDVGLFEHYGIALKIGQDIEAKGEEIEIIPLKHDGKNQYLLCYGHYNSREKAIQAIQKLAQTGIIASIRKQPYINHKH